MEVREGKGGGKEEKKRVEGRARENGKEGEGGCKMQGVGTENCQGETLGFGG